jgi:hypothetical protein
LLEENVMTQHGKIIITLGIGIFTAGALLWIILQNWQWIAAGAAIFVGSAFTALILSVETKNVTPPQPPTIHPTQNNWGQTQTQDNWQPPNTPPPDEGKAVVAEDVAVDPFYGKQDPNGGTPA